MNHLMVDIETLDVSRNAVILAIAAVKFDKNEREVVLNERIPVAYQVHEGRTISGSTVSFWLQQDSNLFKRLLEEPSKEPEEIEYELVQAVNHSDFIWACSPTFDFEILRTWCSHWPQTFRKERDVRTVRDYLSDNEINDIVSRYDLHDPLEDCYMQIDIVRKFWEKLK